MEKRIFTDRKGVGGDMNMAVKRGMKPTFRCKNRVVGSW